jgi:hypothetical protein
MTQGSVAREHGGRPDFSPTSRRGCMACIEALALAAVGSETSTAEGERAQRKRDAGPDAYTAGLGIKEAASSGAREARRCRERAGRGRSRSNGT